MFSALPGLGLPIIIIGGIISGVFSATEAAAVAVLYGFFVGMFIYREITWKDLPGIFIKSAQTAAGIM
ncbi:TRAP transporter large permease subunit, partial [Acinetobacter soli]|uniref:TRAP transporter large permease subunit n=1 Tax=Acinetobacter soli TaxID=487316 RepID=UPI0028138EFD